MGIIAFHGDFASPKMLKEDIGNLPDLVWLPIRFMSSTNWLDAIAEIDGMLDPKEGIVGIGYSRGCGVIADLSYQYPELFRAVVVYEGPLGRLNNVGGSFPALVIWNEYGRMFRRAAQRANTAWLQHNRQVQFVTGNGHHVKIDQTKRPRLRHGWDQSLNQQIADFINHYSVTPTPSPSPSPSTL